MEEKLIKETLIDITDLDISGMIAKGILRAERQKYLQSLVFAGVSLCAFALTAMIFSKFGKKQEPEEVKMDEPEVEETKDEAPKKTSKKKVKKDG